MDFTRKDIELTAPAGSFESLMAAVKAGADSVYFGVENLNMRARSAYNFSRNDLAGIARIARDNGIKAYLTLNTVVYNKEIQEIREIADLAKSNGIDAIIGSDPAVLAYCLKSGIEVHLSTQLNISNLESLRFYSKFGDAVVLARELDLRQVAEISRGIQNEKITGPSGNLVRLEMFVHGALCMAISGKCYLSLHEHNHSANRGDCFQVCRRSYILSDAGSENEIMVDNEYLMSPKDLMTIHFLNKIIDCGVRILKIEGRARSPEYVQTVTSCYHEAINSIIEGTYTRKKIDAWKGRLEQVFNRGFWNGYYLGQRLGEWSDIYGSRSALKKIYLGKVNNYFRKVAVAEFNIETGELRTGDQILITGPTTGVVNFEVSEIRVNKKITDISVKGERCSVPVPEVLRRADKLYKVVPAYRDRDKNE
jgi:putative protease